MIHQTSTLTTSFPQEVPIDPLDSLDAPLDPLGPLNIPLGQVLAPEFLSARCSVSGDMKGGQVGYPLKRAIKMQFRNAYFGSLVHSSLKLWPKPD